VAKATSKGVGERGRASPRRPDGSGAPTGPAGRAPRRRLPETWRAELGAVDEPSVLIMAGLDRLSRTVQEAYHGDLRAYGLTYSEYVALHTLRVAGPPYRATPTELNRVLGLSSGGVTKIVDRLEEAGLVRRAPDPRDGRGVRVALTARGRRLAARIFDAGLAKYAEKLAHLGSAERRRLVESLGTLLDAFELPEGF
jgi:DNA-binding MarR family transcriptional regulator